MEKITIVTVTFNAAATLERTIQSVTDQTYPNTEFIIIDGGSQDGTLDIIKKHQNSIAYWISEKDDGIYDAMNKGIDAATGDKILFLGADDCLVSNEALENIFATANYHNVDILYGNVELSTSKRIFGAEKDYQKLLEQNISHQAIFYSKSLFKKKGKFITRYKILADYHYNLQLFRDTTVLKQYLPVTITLFNDRGVSNNTIDKLFFNDMLVQLTMQDKMPPTHPSIQQYFFYGGFCQLKEKKISAGSKKIMQAIVYGKTKMFFFLVAIKFLLSFAGIGKKIYFK